MEMNLHLGKYVPKNSLIHRLDARYKVVIMFLIMVAAFMNIGFTGLTILFLFVNIGFILSKLTWRNYRKPVVFALILFLLIFVINFLVYSGGVETGDGLGHSPNAYPLPWWPGHYFEPIVFFFSLKIAIRIFIIMLSAQIFIATTKSNDITNALIDLMKPLRIIKFPVEETALIISIAIRFIPTILTEATMVLNAQASRGVDFKHGNTKQKTKALTALIVPLVINSFSRSDELSDAIETRGYIINSPRTRYHVFKITKSDVWMFLGFLVLFGFLFAMQLDAWFAGAGIFGDSGSHFKGDWIPRFLDPEYYGIIYQKG